MSRTIGFWVATGLFALALGSSGVGDLVLAAPIVEGLAHLGYPDWFPFVLGFWKVAGVAAILTPGLPRLKEWAYAGFFFVLTGAAASHVLAGDAWGTAVPALALLALGVTSYALRPTRVEAPSARLAPA